MRAQVTAVPGDWTVPLQSSAHSGGLCSVPAAPAMLGKSGTPILVSLSGLNEAGWVFAGVVTLFKQFLSFFLVSRGTGPLLEGVGEWGRNSAWS